MLGEPELAVSAWVPLIVLSPSLGSCTGLLCVVSGCLITALRSHQQLKWIELPNGSPDHCSMQRVMLAQLNPFVSALPLFCVCDAGP